MDKNELIIAVLKCRAAIVERVINGGSAGKDEDYYQGKLEGYQQAIDLLNSSEESIGIEL